MVVIAHLIRLGIGKIYRSRTITDLCQQLHFVAIAFIIGHCLYQVMVCRGLINVVQAFEAACWLCYPGSKVRLQCLAVGETDVLAAVGQLDVGQAPRYIGI